jgi:dienelactone hydrolase
MTIKKTVITFFLFIATVALNAQSSNFTFYIAKSEVSKHEWILLLPGSSGLTIFEDSTFYNRKAEYLIHKGYDVLLLDYKAYYQASNSIDKPKGTTGEKISWVVKQIIQLTKDKQQIDLANKGHIIGWSLAGEGIFKLLQDTAFITENKINSVALFYPSNNEKIEITSSIPVLIQIGQSDKTVIADKLQKQIKSVEKIKFITYPSSFHGFDIETITKPKSIKFPPVIGKKHIFLYNKEAAEKAYLELTKFLSEE